MLSLTYINLVIYLKLLQMLTTKSRYVLMIVTAYIYVSVHFGSNGNRVRNNYFIYTIVISPCFRGKLQWLNVLNRAYLDLNWTAFRWVWYSMNLILDFQTIVITRVYAYNINEFWYVVVAVVRKRLNPFIHLIKMLFCSNFNCASE